MNILLEAFVDTNFGDNLFVHIVASQYPNDTFYMIEREGFENSYKTIAKQEKNIVLLDKTNPISYLSQMDAMFIVGGDMFGDRADYSTLISYIRKVKKSEGFIAFLGISLFPQYSRVTLCGLRCLFSLADVIVVREKETYSQIKKIVPWVKIYASSDMVFTIDLTEKKEHIVSHKGVLGISVRRKVRKNDQQIYQNYCEGVAEAATQYLRESNENTVVFLALSCGVFDDAKVADDIKKMCPGFYWDRIKCVKFDGNVDGYIDVIQNCEKIVCTRFHALVFAILLNKPFVPIIYEEKMVRLLNELNYHGIRPHYEQKLEADEILSGFSSNSISEKELAIYMKKAKRFFDEVDKGIEQKRNKQTAKLDKIWKKLFVCFFYNIYRIQRKMICILRKMICILKK